MPPLLLPSAALLEQDMQIFPEDEQRLANAFGEIDGCIREKGARLVVSSFLKEIIREIDWWSGSSTRRELGMYLTRLVLQPHPSLVELDLEGVSDYAVHPTPGWSSLCSLEEFWADEAGRLLAAHDQEGCPEFCIGIACEKGFSDGVPATYQGGVRGFPLVGRAEVPKLHDAYIWVPDAAAAGWEVSISEFRANCATIGVSSIENPSGGSHCKVRLVGGGSWVLDLNIDPIAKPYLRQLVNHTGIPFLAIVQALKTGKLPPYELRLEKYAC